MTDLVKPGDSNSDKENCDQTNRQDHPVGSITDKIILLVPSRDRDPPLRRSTVRQMGINDTLVVGIG